MTLLVNLKYQYTIINEFANACLDNTCVTYNNKITRIGNVGFILLSSASLYSNIRCGRESELVS